MKKILTILITILLFNINVEAASICSYKEQTEINSKAANVKFTYEIKEEVVGNSGEGYIKYLMFIRLINVTEEFYVVVKNNYDDSKTTYTGSDAKNGIITIEWTNFDKVTNFTAEVYTTNKTSCPNERYKTLYLTIPRYNEHAERTVCLDYPDFSLCQRFVTFGEIDDVDFVDKMIKHVEEIENDKKPVKPIDKDEVTLMDKIIEFLDNYKFIILGGLVIITGTIIIVHKRKTKKQRELGL